MKASSRTVAVTGGAVGGFCVAGPLGGYAGAVAGGAACDGAITGVDSAIHGEYRPSGLIENGTNIHHGIQEGDSSKVLSNTL